MKVAIEAQRLFRPRKHGMDVAAYELTRRLPLANDRHDYHLLIKNDSDKCIEKAKWREVHTMPSMPYPVWEQALLPNYCARMKPDLLHCTSSTAPIRVKQPLLLTLHDVIFFEQSYQKASLYQRVGNAYRNSLVPFIAKKAKHIITVSEYQKYVIAAKLRLPFEKISVIYNAADDRFFKSYKPNEIEPVVNKYGAKPGYIFFMANTEPRKNTSGVLKAYSLLLKQYSSPPRLLIKGLKPEQLHAHLEHEKLTYLARHIDLIGYVEHNDLPMIYQGACMLWYPSFSEGFGLPIIEAMAGGVPVITSDASSIPEIAGDAALLINPYEPQSITDAAMKILSHPATAIFLSQKGKRRASFFTWDNSVKQLVQLYNDIEQTI